MWAGHIEHIGETRCLYRILVGKPEGKRPFVRPRPYMVGNVQVCVTEMGMGCGLHSYGSE
jgi:hypothetical protein